jgi:hypothetical protein
MKKDRRYTGETNDESAYIGTSERNTQSTAVTNDSMDEGRLAPGAIRVNAMEEVRPNVGKQRSAQSTSASDSEDSSDGDVAPGAVRVSRRGAVSLNRQRNTTNNEDSIGEDITIISDMPAIGVRGPPPNTQQQQQQDLMETPIIAEAVQDQDDLERIILETVRRNTVQAVEVIPDEERKPPGFGRFNPFKRRNKMRSSQP